MLRSRAPSSTLKRRSSISRTDLEIMCQPMVTTKTRKRSGEKVSVTFENRLRGSDHVETCPICWDTTSDGGANVFKLDCCDHSFHRVCLNDLRSPVCPLCRAPVNASIVGLELVKLMEDRRRSDIVDNNEAGARIIAAQIEQELMHTETRKIQIGSQQWRSIVRWLVEDVGIERCVGLTDISELRSIHSVSEFSNVSESALWSLVKELVFSISGSREVRPTNLSLFEWFISKVSRHHVGSKILHEEARFFFPSLSGETITTHALIVLKELHMAELKRLGFELNRICK